MSYHSKDLTCPDCDRMFTFSAADQDLFNELGYEQPGRCEFCRRSREERRRSASGGRYLPYPFGLSLITASAPGASRRN
jgi:hypothetical protein